jgi:hypothetical protein
MLLLKVLFDPCHQVVFKSSLDDLMQDVWCEKLMYIGVGEVVCKWLKK